MYAFKTQKKAKRMATTITARVDSEKKCAVLFKMYFAKREVQDFTTYR